MGNFVFHPKGVGSLEGGFMWKWGPCVARLFRCCLFF